MKCSYGDMGIRLIRGKPPTERYAAVCRNCEWVGAHTTSVVASRMAKLHVKEGVR
jgi:hypothetical protein